MYTMVKKRELHLELQGGREIIFREDTRKLREFVDDDSDEDWLKM